MGAYKSTLPLDNSSNNGGSSEMGRPDIIPSPVFNTRILQWRISVIYKNLDKLYVSTPLPRRRKKGNWG
jgi:hypothetical protein